MTPPKSHPEANVYIPKKVQFLGIHGRKKTTLTASISTWAWAHGKHGEIESSPPSKTHDGSMVLLYMVTWIPSIYPKC